MRARKAEELKPVLKAQPLLLFLFFLNEQICCHRQVWLSHAFLRHKYLLWMTEGTDLLMSHTLQNHKRGYSITHRPLNDWEQDSHPQSLSPSLSAQEAVGSASNQRFSLASWRYQFTDGLNSFVRAHGFSSLQKSFMPLSFSLVFFCRIKETLVRHSLHLFFFLWLCWIRCVFSVWPMNTELLDQKQS